MFTQAAIKRKSVRSYSSEKFSDETKLEIAQAIKELTPLYDDAVTSFKLVPENLIHGEVKGRAVKAPYYIIISADKADGYLENAGYMAEQLVIWLTEKGIGSCYCGMVRPREVNDIEGEYCITLALGYPSEKESFRQSEEEFKRKDLEKYLIGDKENDFLEPFIRYARLAPSAINKQPAIYEMNGAGIVAYRQKPGMISYLEKMQRIDLGISLSHIFMYAKENGYHVDFYKDNVTPKDKLVYFISLNIMEEIEDE